MITKVSLKSWRSHQDSDFIFTGGTNALLGISGSGKSSVLDAVCFALFGTFPILQAKKLKIEDLIMRKPMEKQSGEVEVQFVVDGKTYSVKRTIERGRGTTYSEIRENGKILESPSTSRVTELVEKILKVNYDLFSKAIYSEQNSMDYFLTIPKGMRMKKIDELLMIDKFEKARSGTVSLTNKISDRKSGKQSIVDNVNVEDLDRVIRELKSSLDRDWSDKSSFERKLAQVSAARQKLESDYSSLHKSRDSLETLKRDERGLSSVIEEIGLSISNLESKLKGVDVESVEKTLSDLSRYSSELERNLREMRAEYDRRSNHAAKSRAEFEAFAKQSMSKLEADLREKTEIAKSLEGSDPIDDLEKKSHEKKKSLEKIVAEIEVLGSKISDVEEIISDISSSDGKCPVCESKLTKEVKTMLLKQKSFQLQKLRDRISELGEKKELTESELRNLEGMMLNLEDMMSAIKDLDKLRKEYENAQHIYQVLKESASKSEEELLSIRGNLERLQSDFDEALQKKQSIESVGMRIEEFKQNRERLKNFLSERERMLSRMAVMEKSLAGQNLMLLESELRKLTAEEREYATRLVTMEPTIREKESRLADMKRNLDAAMRERDEIKKLDGMIRQLKIFEKSLEQTQHELRKEFVASVNFAMNEIWPNLYPYKDFAGLRLAVDESDYTLQLQDKSGRWVNVEGFASGGERSIAALTLRIAFALVLAPQLKWLVLDEPTHNLDSKAVEDLAVTLSERIGNFIDQVFLITHDEKLENAVVGSLYRLERDKSTDGYTKAVLVS
jgi:exonuclease SbcC